MTLALQMHLAQKRAPRNGLRYQVVAYLRVSHDSQPDNYTFETQETRIREKLDQHYGVGEYDVTIYKDDGLSGAFGPVASGIQRKTRPTLKQLEKEITSNCYDCLAVYNFSRLFRSVRWVFQWLEDVLIPSGIEFISATENLDITSSQGRTMLGVLAVLNAAYREDCQNRNRDALATRRKEGYTLGPAPYGWQFEPRAEQGRGGRRGIVPDAMTQPHVLYMRDRYLAGAGAETIARELNERNVLTPQGRKWVSTRILQVLLHPAHAGYVPSPEEKLIKGQHYPHRLWEMDVHEQLVSLCQQRRRCSKTNTGKSNSPHLINGIALCARCGKRLYTTGGRYRGYYCRSGRNHGQPTCQDVYIHADIVECAVSSEIAKVAQDPRMRELLRAGALNDHDEYQDKLEKELAQWEQAAANAQGRSDYSLQLLLNRTISEADFLSNKQVVEAELLKAQQQVQGLKKKLENQIQREAWVKRVEEAIENFSMLWEAATLDERRQLLMTLVETLTVDRQERDVVIRIKLHLLPEQELRVSLENTRHMKIKPVGVAALTPRNLAYLYYVGQGKSPKEIAEAMGTGVDCCYTFAMIIRNRLGVKSLEEAYQMARSHIEQQLPFLPLIPNKRCKLMQQEVPQLTDALKEVFPLLAEGMSKREVAQRTGLTYDAVAQRGRRILELFHAKTFAEAAKRAHELGVSLS